MSDTARWLLVVIMVAHFPDDYLFVRIAPGNYETPSLCETDRQLTTPRPFQGVQAQGPDAVGIRQVSGSIELTDALNILARNLWPPFTDSLLRLLVIPLKLGCSEDEFQLFTLRVNYTTP